MEGLGIKKSWLKIIIKFKVKYSLIIILSLLLTSLVFVSCDIQNESQIRESHTENIEEEDTVNVMELYYKVLNGDEDFIDYSNAYGEINPNEANINELYYCDQKEYPMVPTKVALVDFDNDGMDEVVILTNIINEDSENSTEIEYLVFHYYNGRVYGYEHIYRGMEGLDTSGNYIGSSGAGDNKFFGITFEGEVEVEKILAESTTIYDETRCSDSTKAIWFFIGDEEVKEDEYLKYINSGIKVTWEDYIDNSWETLFE